MFLKNPIVIFFNRSRFLKKWVVIFKYQFLGSDSFFSGSDSYFFRVVILIFILGSDFIFFFHGSDYPYHILILRGTLAYTVYINSIPHFYIIFPQFNYFLGYMDF